ncbi:hypothetical protein HQO42_23570 [Rhodococcus fascians]|nr:hypothetical protein [Rhodococcus fascians]MBY4240034.1 hypothetical protein [Rhodococcus fascians]MBY4255638.1 hypothetical protein [Rhodococcus fascians]MBY4271499.1 hypothetical protein [Rhodococcus fascians]
MSRTSEIRGCGDPVESNLIAAIEVVQWIDTGRLHCSIGYLSFVGYENGYRQNCSTATSGREVA